MASRIFRNFLMASVGTALLSSCAPTTQMAVPTGAAVEKETALQEELVRGGFSSLPRAPKQVSSDMEMRTFLIGNRVLIGGAPLCGKKVRQTMPFGLREDANKEIEILWSVDTDGKAKVPAAGDVLKSLDGVPIAPGRRAARDVLAALAMASKADKSIKVGVERAGKPMDFDVAPTPACDYNIKYDLSEVLNAYADGKNMIINRGIIRVMGDDDELAGVIAHELAHNAMGHLRSLGGNALLGGLLGAAIAIASGADGDAVQDMAEASGNAAGLAFSSDFEAEADYVGTYIMARSGFDYEAMTDTMRRLASTESLKAKWGQTHPATPQRAAAADATIDEIKRKIAAGQPLMPEMKATAPKSAKKPTK